MNDFEMHGEPQAKRARSDGLDDAAKAPVFNVKDDSRIAPGKRDVVTKVPSQPEHEFLLAGQTVAVVLRGKSNNTVHIYMAQVVSVEEEEVCVKYMHKSGNQFNCIIFFHCIFHYTWF